MQRGPPFLVLRCHVGAVVDDEPCKIHISITRFRHHIAAELTPFRPAPLRRRRSRRETVRDPDFRDMTLMPHAAESTRSVLGPLLIAARYGHEYAWQYYSPPQTSEETASKA